MIETRYNTYNKPKPETCHCSNPKPGGTCCDLVCFERPNYFCGHLLTDTDLSTEQQYVIEKHKLYNRTLHGWGVVCGLRLTCDRECGGIMIDEGYAIDDCGNDLVVCEPLRFDVLAKLKEKGYVVGDAAYDPCKPEEDQPDCDYRQCFYVAICYEEEPREFTTPFVAGCTPTLTECEPTRIREGVWFDVLDELPQKNDWAEELLQRLEACFCLFTKGAFAHALQTNTSDLETILKSPAQITPGQYDNLFCELRGLLLLFLKKHPDRYNCKLDDEIRNIILPDQKTYQTNYGANVRSAFCELLRLAWQYAISCALGELIPRCPGPNHASCVVLGTVEVRGGCVTHVCNCPRSYVWSFANFWQVLVATVIGGAACEEDKREDKPYTTGTSETGTNLAGANVTNRHDDACDVKPHHICCAEFDFDCEWLLGLLSVSPRSLNLAGTASVRAFSSLAKSVREAFNFATPDTFSPAILQNLNREQLMRAINTLQLKNVSYRQASVAPEFVHPVEMMYRSGLAKPAESAVVAEYNDENVIVNAYAVPLGHQAEETTKQLESRVLRAELAADEANLRVQDIERRIAATEDYLLKLTGAAEVSIDEIRKRIHDELARVAGEDAKKAAQKKRSSRRRSPGPKQEGENG